MPDRHLTEAELESLRDNLLALKADLEDVLVASQESAGAVELDQSKVGRLSRMDAMQQQAMAVAKRGTYQRQLREVIQALARMEEGDYGYCIECDAAIPSGRLRIKPEAAFCLACQEHADS